MVCREMAGWELVVRLRVGAMAETTHGQFPAQKKKTGCRSTIFLYKQTALIYSTGYAYQSLPAVREGLVLSRHGYGSKVWEVR